MSWTPERVDELRRLTELNMSAAQIAVQLECSRSAVTAKWQRLGIRGDHAAACARHNRSEQRRRRLAQKKRPAPTLVAPPVQMTVPFDGGGVALVDLQTGQCRWIDDVQEPWLYCGQPSGPDTYCQHHKKMACGGLPVKRKPGERTLAKKLNWGHR